MPLINRLYYRFRIFFAARWPRLFCICEKRKSVIKFFFSGSLAGITDLIALFIFHGLMHWHIVVATSVAFLLSFAVSFSLQKLWTFRNYSHKRLPRQLAMYLGNAFLSLNINGFGMHLLVNGLEIWYLLSQILVNIGLGIMNFFVYKFIIFRSVKDEDQNR